MTEDGVSKARSEVLKFALAAVILATGVELYTAPILGPSSSTALVCVILGVSLTIGVLGYLLFGALRGAGIKRDISGYIFFKNKDFEPVDVDGYAFSDDATHYLKALFAENSAHAKTWSAMAGEKNAVGRPRKPDEKMALELYEYYFLNQLSLHLSEVFESGAGADPERISNVKREDIPDILLSNRFLETFSKDMSDRAAFVDSPPQYGVKKGSESKVIYAFGKDGALFDLFELVLPKGSAVKRHKSGTLLIETSKFVLSTKATFYGFVGTTPFGFEELYLGVPRKEVDAKMIQASVELEFKIGAIMAPGGWEYFDWAESFVSKFEQEFSFDAFLKEIAWRESYTTAKILSKNKSRRALAELPDATKA